MLPKEVLESNFGYNNFRPGQEEIITACLNDSDVLAILPTGGGKSLCFQVPGLILPGTTIVVSPLIALMEDQVQALQRRNIAAVFLSSSLKEAQKIEVVNKLRSETVKFVYVSPERLQNQQFWQICQNLLIPLVVIDEAHCISQWGDSFRPEYYQILDFIKKLVHRPRIIALTASATRRVEKDVVEKLNLRKNYFRHNQGVSRSNLRLQVIKCNNLITQQLYLLRILKKHQGQTGIIYTATRKSTSDICNLLANRYGITTPLGNYHGGMDPISRSKIQDQFLQDKIKIITATNAFGMGIDKPNIRFVIHYQYPASLEAYYQEVGRAGRDGEVADCYTFHEPTVQNIHLELIKKQTDVSRRNKLRQLAQLEAFVSSKKCRMSNLQAYFGEGNQQKCGRCDNCTNANKNKFWWQLFLEDESEKNCLESLFKFRYDVCQKMNIHQSLFLTNQQLCLIALLKPQENEEFLKIPGLGTGWLNQWRTKIPKFKQIMVQCTSYGLQKNDPS